MNSEQLLYAFAITMIIVVLLLLAMSPAYLTDTQVVYQGF